MKSRPTILVIEDQQVIREEMLETLGYEGFETIGAANGLVGVELAREQSPDLIICDISMPEMDGFEVLEELRSDSSTATVPFIFLTAHADRSSMRKGMALGADDYISKPFTYEELLAAIRSRLAKEAAFETQQLRIFSQNMVTRQEQQGRQFAAWLRDEIGPQLSGLELSLEMSQHLPDGNLRQVIDEAQALARAVIGQVNDFAIELWPSVLDHLGLLPALIWHTERYASQTQIFVKFEHDGLRSDIGFERKIAVFRVVQEALDNVAKHAEISEASLRVWAEDNTLNVQVIDNGKGFDVEQVLRSNRANGLMAIRERTQALGGSLTVASMPDVGTELMVRIPLFDSAEISTEAANAANPPKGMAVHPIDTHSLSVSPPGSSRPPKPFAQESADQQITIVLAESSDIVRRGLRSLLGAESGLIVIGEVAQGQEVAGMVEKLRPEILILSLIMPGVGGLEITPQVIQRSPGTSVVLLSAYADDAYVGEALRQGATGYILRDTVLDDLVDAVYTVRTGKHFLSAPLTNRAIEVFMGKGSDSEVDSLDGYATLTGREREVLHLIVEGYTNAEIADSFVISKRTVETHRANMMRKLGLRNKADLFRYAVRRGLISADNLGQQPDGPDHFPQMT